MNSKRYLMVSVVLFSIFVQTAGAAELVISKDLLKNCQ
jgi:hypothetical protein